MPPSTRPITGCAPPSRDHAIMRHRVNLSCVPSKALLAASAGCGTGPTLSTSGLASMRTGSLRNARHNRPPRPPACAGDSANLTKNPERSGTKIRAARVCSDGPPSGWRCARPARREGFTAPRGIIPPVPTRLSHRINHRRPAPFFTSDTRSNLSGYRAWIAIQSAAGPTSAGIRHVLHRPGLL